MIFSDDVVELVASLDGRQEQTFTGRFAWCLNELIEAGDRGCSPLERPAPRWSHYVWSLRTEQGVSIESTEQQHAGPYAGRHVRYRLASKVEVAKVDRATDARAAA